MSIDNPDLYPENTSFNFTSVVPENSLDDVPEGPLDAAVKVISFNNTRNSRFRYDERIGVRSNLSDKIITSGTWDNIIALSYCNNSNNEITICNKIIAIIIVETAMKILQ